MNDTILEEQKFMEEVNEIIEKLSQSEITIIVKDSFNYALKATLLSKKEVLQNAGGLLKKAGENTNAFIKTEIEHIKLYRKGYIPNMLPRLRDASINTKDNIIETIDYKVETFKTMSTENKKEILISGILWTATVLVAGGGTDFEGGIPDLDIKIGGIGNHRNVFSHTILVGLFFEFFIRLLIKLLKHGREFLPDDKSGIWKYIEKFADIIDENETILISGMWVGLSIHLLKDANIFADRTKPYVGIPKTMKMKSHQNMFAGNSFLSFLFGERGE